MAIPWQAIEGFAGATGVGALCLLGVFLIADGRSPGIFPTVEFYAKTATWGIVVAIPIVAISYVMGLLAIGAADLLMSTLFKTGSFNQVSDLVSLSKKEASTLLQRYQQLRQDQEILGGSATAFLLLAFGALSEISNLQSLRKVIILCAIGAVIVAVVAFIFAVHKGNTAHCIANAAKLLQE